MSSLMNMLMITPSPYAGTGMSYAAGSGIREKSLGEARMAPQGINAQGLMESLLSEYSRGQSGTNRLMSVSPALGIINAIMGE